MTMEKLITLDAVAAPLPFDNLDTDQLMPKQFLRGIDKSGLAAGLLYNMRFLPTGDSTPTAFSIGRASKQPGFSARDRISAAVQVESTPFGAFISSGYALS